MSSNRVHYLGRYSNVEGGGTTPIQTLRDELKDITAKILANNQTVANLKAYLDSQQMLLDKYLWFFANYKSGIFSGSCTVGGQNFGTGFQQNCIDVETGKIKPVMAVSMWANWAATINANAQSVGGVITENSKILTNILDNVLPALIKRQQEITDQLRLLAPTDPEVIKANGDAEKATLEAKATASKIEAEVSSKKTILYVGLGLATLLTIGFLAKWFLMSDKK